MLTIVKGRTFSFDATIYDTYVAEGDPGNVPTNHTGWTIRSQIRKKIGNVLVANLNVTFPVPTAGTVAIRHDRVFTRSLPVGDYWWDIVATDASGNDHVYVEPEPIAVHDHPTDPANAVYDFVPGGGGAISHTHSISDITGLQALLDDRLPPDGGTIARYLRGDNTWQLLNKSAVGLSLVENVTLSTWIGSSNITRLGTIISGSWQGSRIAPAYLGDGTSIETKFLRGDGTWQTVSGGAYIDLTDATTVNLPSVNTPLSSALSGKAATSHTHLSADITDATSAATPSTLVRRDASGNASFGQIFSFTLTVTGGTTFGDASLIQFDAVEYYYGTGAAAAHRTALGSGATGDALFTAVDAPAARTTLGLGSLATINSPLPVANGGTGTTNGSITGTGALTFTAGGSNQNVNLAPSGTGLLTIIGNTNNTGIPIFRATNNFTGGGGAGFVNTFEGLAPNLGVGSRVYMAFGVGESTNNRAGLGFHYIGVGSANNFLAVGGFYGATGNLCIFPNGGVSIAASGNPSNPGAANLRVGGTTASTDTTTGALVVAGGAGIAGTVNAGSLALTAPLPITSGGTGATTAPLARTALGSGATGDQLFTAATPAAARTILEINRTRVTQALDLPVLISSPPVATDLALTLTGGVDYLIRGVFDMVSGTQAAGQKLEMYTTQDVSEPFGTSSGVSLGTLISAASLGGVALSSLRRANFWTYTGAGLTRRVQFEIVIKLVSTGVISIAFAQAASGATASVFKAGSFLTAEIL